MRPLDPPLVPPPGPEPAYCPRCALRHSRRPDWLCPRCGSPVDAEVPAPTPAPLPGQGFPLASRIAGGVLAATGVAYALAITLNLATIPPGAPLWRLVAGVVVLAALGLALLLRLSVARWIAAVLASIGAVILAEELFRVLLPGLLRDPLPGPVRQLLRNLIRDHRPTSMLLSLGLDAGCLLLLLGRPRVVRIVAGVLLAAPLSAVVLVRALWR